jgi:hypothetical protein
MQWREVKQIEFDRFIREYPRRLEPAPPLNRKANFREWRDRTLGDWPTNVVATSCTRHKSLRYQVINQ